MTLEERAASKYWYSPEGISRRINMLSQSFTYKIVNNSLLVYGESAGITRWRWISILSEPPGPDTCKYCRSQHGRIYRKGQFLPPLPAHALCYCQWELLFPLGELPQYVI